jgi:hypothetical protein
VVSAGCAWLAGADQTEDQIGDANNSVGIAAGMDAFILLLVITIGAIAGLFAMAGLGLYAIAMHLFVVSAAHADMTSIHVA